MSYTKYKRIWHQLMNKFNTLVTAIRIYMLIILTNLLIRYVIYLIPFIFTRFIFIFSRQKKNLIGQSALIVVKIIYRACLVSVAFWWSPMKVDIKIISYCTGRIAYKARPRFAHDGFLPSCFNHSVKSISL